MPRISLVYAAPGAEQVLGVCPTATKVSRTWTLNEPATASYELPLTQPDLARIVRLGAVNWLYEDGVPPFVGYVESRGWDDTSVKVGLRSAEGLLKGQLTRQGLVLGADGNTNAGTVAYNVFLSGVIRNNGRSPLRAGIFDAAGARFIQCDYADVLDTFAVLAQDYTAAFWVDEDLRVHFRSSRGQDRRSSIILVQGRNLINVSITESIADTINAGVALGDGATIAARPKKTLAFATATQFRAEVLNFSGVKGVEVLTDQLVGALRKRRWPRVTIDAELPRTAPEWGQFFLGDVVRVVATRLPWEAEYDCRLIGAEIDEADRMRLVLEVLTPESYDSPGTWALS